MLAKKNSIYACFLGAMLGSQSVLAASEPRLVELEAIKRETFTDLLPIVGSIAPKQVSTLSTFV